MIDPTMQPQGQQGAAPQQPQGMPGQPQQGGPPMNGQMLSQVRQQTQMPDLQALSQNGPSSVGMPG